MLYGLEKKTEDFKKVIGENRLRQSYLFFGEHQIGKFTFAASLVNFLENQEFAVAARPLLDAEFFLPTDQAGLPDDSGSIGIEAVKRLKKFLYQRPIASSRRSAIFDSDESLTPEAQNALLKIIEDPPHFSLIIFIARETSVFSATLASRFAKVYFPRLSQKSIEKYLEENFRVDSAKAGLIAKQSFGRIGRAIEIIKQETGGGKKEAGDNLGEYIEETILSLRKNILKNSSKLSWLLEREELIKRHNLNPKLQYRAIKEKLKV